MRSWELRVKLQNGLTIQNPDVRCFDMDWGSELYSSGIEFIRLALPGRIFTLMNYEQYNFFLEAVQDLTGRGNIKLESIFLCGASQDFVDVLQITKSRIKVYRRPLGKEYNGTSSRGWKKGVEGKTPKLLREKVNGDQCFSLQS